MDYEIANPESPLPVAPPASEMHVLLADFANKPFQEICALIPELSVAPSLWNWVIIRRNEYDAIMELAKSYFAISAITLDEPNSNKFAYPKIVKRVVAQQATSNQTKMIFLIIDDNELRLRIKYRFIRSASRQLRERFIDFRLSEQSHTAFELTQLAHSCSISLRENNHTSTASTQPSKIYETQLHSVKALLSLIISFRSIAQIKRSHFVQSSEENYFDAIIEELSDYSRSDMHVYKESHIAQIAQSVAIDHKITSVRELLIQLKSQSLIKSAFVQQLSLTPNLLKEDMPLLRQTLQQAAVQLKLWAKGNAGELRIWIPNFRHYSLVREIASHIKKTLAAVDDSIILKVFASDNDISRIQRAKTAKAADKTIIGCNIILAHHDLMCQAPFSNIHILFLFKFMSHLGLSYANRLYSIYHFAMISGGILISDEPLTEEGSRYFTKPSTATNHYINQRKSKRIQYPQLSTIQRRPVKMALPPQSVKKITSSLDKHYQTALLNKIISSHDETLLVVDESLRITHFYGVTDHFINPYIAGQFCFSLDRLLGSDHAHRISECLPLLEEKDTHKIPLNAAKSNDSQSHIIELSILPLLSDDQKSNTPTVDKSPLLYSIRIRNSGPLAEPQLAYNRLLSDRIKRLETRVDAINQKYVAHKQWLTVSKDKLAETREKAALSIDEHSQLRKQFSDVANELTKLNASHKLLLSSLKEDCELKGRLLASSGFGVLICDFAFDNYRGIGALEPIIGNQPTSAHIKQTLTKAVPSVQKEAQRSATDGEPRTKVNFIFGKLVRFSINPIIGITQELSGTQCPSNTQYQYRVAIIFQGR